MANEPKTYMIDDIQNGYNNFDKLREIYREIREKVLTGNPVQTSDMPLLTIYKCANSRPGNYGWELYLLNSSSLILEYYGDWTGYGSETRIPPAPENAKLSKLKITINNSEKSLEEKIEGIISRYHAKK